MSLLDWDITSRIQFYIPPTTVSGADNIPFVFRLGATTGTTGLDTRYIFNALADGPSSVGNRKKVIFSQVIDGDEQPLYTELDLWDHIGTVAIFWVRPIELSSVYNNIFFFYYDKTHADNTRYLSETSDTSVNLFMDLGVEGTNDVNGVIAGKVLKVGTTYHMWYSGRSTYWNMMHCQSTDLVTWTGHQRVMSHSIVNDNSHRLYPCVIYDESIYKMWYTAYYTALSRYTIMYAESVDGITWTNFQQAVPQGTTPFNGAYSFGAVVLKEGPLYKMWYSGYTSTTSPTVTVLYCESTDGITWDKHQQVLDDVLGTDKSSVPYIRPNSVLYKNNLYMMWFSEYNGGSWRGYYGESKDGINWSNFSLCVDLNILGVYDVATSGVAINIIEVDSYYHYFFSGQDASDVWRIITSKSVSLQGLKTPSQEVWTDFNVVHHLNSSYGYIDSTAHRINSINTNSVLPVSSNLGGSAIELLTKGSYIELGSSDVILFEKDTSIIIFGNITSTGNLFTKGSYLRLFYPDYSVSLNNYMNITFEGTDGDNADLWLWDSYTYDTRLAESVIEISSNRLKLHSLWGSADYGSTYVVPSFWLFGDFNIEFAFSDFDSTGINNMAGLFDGMLIASAEYGSKWWFRIPGVSDLHQTGRVYAYGQIRVSRVGTTYYIYTKDGPDTTWTLQYSGGDGTAPEYQFLLRAYVANYDNTYSTIYIDSCTISADYIKYLYANIYEQNYNASFGLNSTAFVEDTTVDSVWHTHGASRGADLSEPNLLNYREDGKSVAVMSDATLDGTAFIGSKYNSVLGKIAEFWILDATLSSATGAFIDKVLKDQAITLSTNFVQGFATAYGKAVATKVLVYDKETKLLVGYSDSAAYDGYYYVETTSNAECFVIGLDGGLYNHYILGKITPS